MKDAAAQMAASGSKGQARSMLEEAYQLRAEALAKRRAKEAEEAETRGGNAVTEDAPGGVAPELLPELTALEDLFASEKAWARELAGVRAQVLKAVRTAADRAARAPATRTRAARAAGGRRARVRGGEEAGAGAPGGEGGFRGGGGGVGGGGDRAGRRRRQRRGVGGGGGDARAPRSGRGNRAEAHEEVPRRARGEAQVV